MRHLGTLFLLLALLGPGRPAAAGWWIFGKSDEPVSTSYLYINGMAWDEAGPDLSLPRDLPGNEIVIKGKGQAGRSAVGAVAVSLAEPEAWQDALLNQDGGFEFRFKPEPGQTYPIRVKITSTTGKTNDAASTLKRVSVGRESLGERVQACLDSLAQAYTGRDPQAFMALVSSGFTPDAQLLDRALRRDFAAFDSIEISLRSSAAVSSQDGRIQVTLSYSRRVVATKGGKAYSDQGSTQLTMVPAGTILQVQAMSQPLIFGLSLPEDVASGNGQAGGLTVLEDGSVGQGGGQGGSAARLPQSVHLACALGCQPPTGFNFATGQSQNPGDFVIMGQTELDGVNVVPANGVDYADLGAVDLASVANVADGLWQDAFGSPVLLKIGQCYAFRMAGNRQALVKIKAVAGLGTPNPVTMDFDYYYQGDGTGVFR